MITLTMLAIMILLILIVLAIAAIVGGASFILTFGDLIVAIFVVVCVVKLIKKRK